MFAIAFYKGTASGLTGLYSVAVRWWTRSEYSHCEIIFSDGMSASAQYMDGGVRFKRINYNPDKWDIIELPKELEDKARVMFNETEGAAYDILGNFGFIAGPFDHSKQKYFCSEICAKALGFEPAQLYYPGILSSSIKRLVSQLKEVYGNRS